MKMMSLVLLSVGLFSAASSVAQASTPCSKLVEKVVASIRAGYSKEKIMNITTDSDLIQISGSTLLYSVQVYETTVNQPLPPAFYNVQAIGSEVQCKVTNVQLKGFLN